jgi:hypothetical protein
LCEDAAFLEADDLCTKLEGLLDVVGDGEDGDVVGGGEGEHGGEEIVAEGAVEAGEGLVEEHKLLIWDGKGAGEVDALALAAGEISGVAVGEGGQMKKAEYVVDILFGSCGMGVAWA